MVPFECLLFSWVTWMFYSLGDFCFLPPEWLAHVFFILMNWQLLTSLLTTRNDVCVVIKNNKSIVSTVDLIFLIDTPCLKWSLCKIEIPLHSSNVETRKRCFTSESKNCNHNKKENVLELLFKREPKYMISASFCVYYHH